MVNIQEAQEPAGELKVDYKTTFKIGLAFAIVMLFWTAYDFVAPLLLEETYGLPNWARGLIMGLDNLLALFMMPLFGRFSDKAKGRLIQKYGRRTPFIAIGTLAAVALMVFVPLSTLPQQRLAQDIQTEYRDRLNNQDFIRGLLGGGLELDCGTVFDGFWREDGTLATGMPSHTTLERNGMTREKFLAIRVDDRLTVSGGFMGMGGGDFYWNGVRVQDKTAIPEGETRTFEEIAQGNSDFSRFAGVAMNNFVSARVFETATMQGGMSSLIVYCVILFLVLLAMGSFRSPAVALMPDVTPKPLRSQANAIISLTGGIGGAVAFLIYTMVLFTDWVSRFVIIFGSVGAAMLIVLGGFLVLVKEKQLVERCKRLCEEFGIVDEPEQAEGPAVKAECGTDGENAGAAAEAAYTADAPQEKAAPAKKAFLIKNPVPQIKAWWGAKSAEGKAKFKSTILILASIWFWFLGWAAVNANLSIYITRELDLSAGVASLVSGAALAVGALAFIPVGWLAGKIGRRKSVLIGYVLCAISFLLIFLFVNPTDMYSDLLRAGAFSAFFIIAGFGMITTNVNTLPMTVDLATSKTVGTYTGYYYMATMSAQAITPTFSGLVMDWQPRFIFIYSIIFIAVAFILMLFVKHGDSFRAVLKRPAPPQSLPESGGRTDEEQE